MKYILLFFTFTFTWSFAFSEGHERVSPKVEFNKAVKFVEKKEFLKALNIFEILANEGFPEAQYNLSLLYYNGVGAPASYRLALYWSWQAHLNLHENAADRVDIIKEEITENLQNEVAQNIIDELLVEANNGSTLAPLKLGKTFLGLFVQPNNKDAYLWLSIAQAYGDEEASSFLSEAASQLTLEEVLAQQDLSQSTFQSIKAD